jgi:hypothetical protein
MRRERLVRTRHDLIMRRLTDARSSLNDALALARNGDCDGARRASSRGVQMADAGCGIAWGTLRYNGVCQRLNTKIAKVADRVYSACSRRTTTWPDHG